MHAKQWKWFHYYWNLCEHLGQETYRTWRWELFSSVPIGFFVAALTGGWKDFRTAVLATALTLGCFVIWHIVRLPWLAHRSTHATGGSEPGFLAGALGVFIIVAMFLGGYKTAIAIWDSKTVATIDSKFAGPQAPQVTIVRSGPPITPIKPQCWFKNYAVPAVSPPPSWGLVIIICNTTIKPPYSVELNYDQNVEVGAFTFPVGSEFAKSMEYNQGTKIVAMFELHTIIPNEPFSVMAHGSGDKFPLVKTGTIRSKGVAFELQR